MTKEDACEEEAEKGLERLMKAYDIIENSAKQNQHGFDNSYKTIIVYNVACCYQMLGDLEQCSTFL